ncbi:MAG: isoprenylcysteine carboxylmethyltransferase family protein [Anaerolineae bacterium]|nr:isoprenylcysteine carboxylmethyltransferase family protein [Anaerolineae bacterium]
MSTTIQSRARRALMLPIVVAGVIPLLLLWATNSLNPLWGTTFPINVIILIAGVGAICAGLYLITVTVRLFTSVGQGTLAPWDATKHLVVEGVYRYVRNPMHTGVFSILLGEALLTGSLAIAIMWAVTVLLHLFYIPLSEERGLEERFGEEYRVYKQHVPRWIPRRDAWLPPQS